jgi:hypothetical protein
MSLMRVNSTCMEVITWLISGALIVAAVWSVLA